MVNSISWLFKTVIWFFVKFGPNFNHFRPIMNHSTSLCYCSFLCFHGCMFSWFFYSYVRTIVIIIIIQTFQSINLMSCSNGFSVMLLTDKYTCLKTTPRGNNVTSAVCRPPSSLPGRHTRQCDRRAVQSFLIPGNCTGASGDD